MQGYDVARRKIVLRLEDFIGRFDESVKQFYKTDLPYGKFVRGASGYFHDRVIEMVRAENGPLSRWVPENRYFLELLYAVLAAWGMDSGQAQLRDFSDFRRAVCALVASATFGSLEASRIDDVNAGWKGELQSLWDLLADDCRVMASASILVGSSKVLHHLLPDLFPPIDRKYTMFLMSHLDCMDFKVARTAAQKPSFNEFFKAMLFFAYVARAHPDVNKHVSSGRPMSASIPKVIDNAILAYVAPRLPRKKKS